MNEPTSARDIDWLARLTSLQHPFGRWGHNIDLTTTAAGPDGIDVEWEVDETLLQPFGLVHGGVHTTLTEALGSVAAALWRMDQILAQDPSARIDPADWKTWPAVVGVSNQTDFFRAAKLGQRLATICRPVHRGRTQQVWLVESHDEQDRLIARGQLRVQNL